MPWIVPLIALIGPLWGPSAIVTEHSKIELTVISETGTERAIVDQTPPPHGKNPRPVVEVRAGEPIRLSYMMTNVYPHETLKDVVVHFYVAPIDRVGQPELPTIGDDVVLETAFDLDLRPGAHAGGRATLRIDAPGIYLVRVETRNTGSDHEHFAALDLRVR